MCGIVGAIGARNITPVLVEGLKRLEYRGYDSCGVAVLQDGQLRRSRSTQRGASQPAAVTNGRHRVSSSHKNRLDSSACGAKRRNHAASNQRPSRASKASSAISLRAEANSNIGRKQGLALCLGSPAAGALGSQSLY